MDRTERPDLSEIERFVELGSVLAGKYRLERVLGVGGMGAVVAAEHLQLGKVVAIKFLLPRGLGKERQATRFVREARAASGLKSPHVARVFDVDQRPDGTPFIVMEYLRGETLASFLKREPRPAVPRVVDDMLEACEAIAEAHSRAIVHRDIKPANLFLAEGAGNILALKVLDFGISKLLVGETSSTDPTTAEAFLGSPPYMSPEQLTQPDCVDHRTDIWSLGIVLYESLTGQSPFKGESAGEVCSLVLQSVPERVDALRPEVPAGLAAIVARCLSKPAAQRFGSVLELATALEPYGTPRGQRVLPVIEAVASLPAGAPSEAGAWQKSALEPAALDTGTLSAAADRERPSSTPAKPRGRWQLGALLLAVLVVSGVLWAARRASHDAAPAGASLNASPTIPSEAELSAPPTKSQLQATAREVTIASPVAPSVAPGAAPGLQPAPRPAIPGSLAGEARKRNIAPHPSSTSAPRPPAPAFDPVYDERR